MRKEEDIHEERRRILYVRRRRVWLRVAILFVVSQMVNTMWCRHGGDMW